MRGEHRPIDPEDFSLVLQIDKNSPTGLSWRRDEMRAGRKNSRGYYSVWVFGELFFNHRIVYALYYWRDPGILVIDHIDRNKSNNTIYNLRLATHWLNAQNVSRPARAG